MFLNIQTDLLILKTYDGQFTLTTKKSLHIIFKVGYVAVFCLCRECLQPKISDNVSVDEVSSP